MNICSLCADVVLSLAFAADAALSLAFAADAVPSLAFGDYAVPSIAFAAYGVAFQAFVIFDERIYLLQKSRFKLLEISKFRKKRSRKTCAILEAIVIVSCSSAKRRACELEVLGKAGSN